MLSGGNCLAFYWRGDQLYARPGPVPASIDPKWTFIFLKLRETLARPHLDRLGNFLVKSIIFTEHIDTLAVHSKLSGLLLRVSRKQSPATELPIKPSSLLASLATRPQGLFTLKESTTRALQIDLDKRYTSQPRQGDRSILSSLWSFAKSMTKAKDQLQEEEALLRPGVFSLFLHVVASSLKVSASRSFSAAMERIMKKGPAPRINLSTVYCSYDEAVAASARGHLRMHPILGSVIPEPDEGGRLFIGFETHQTVGCALHVAGPFIPTVERESLDFVDPTLAAWNEELLRMAARIARVLYEIEAASLRRLYPGAGDGGGEGALPDAYWDRARHLLRTFGIRSSSPSPAPANLLLHEFFSATTQELAFPSSCGVVALSALREIPPAIASFARTIPLVDRKRLQGCEAMLDAIAAATPKVSHASISEVLASLKHKQLPMEQLYDCLSWVVDLNRQGALSTRAFFSLASCLEVPCGSHSDPLVYKLLSGITHFAIRETPDGTKLPLPDTCLAPVISKRFLPYELASALNLRELDLASQARHLCDCQALRDPEACELLLIFLSECFSQLPEEERAQVASILSDVPVIPTTKGLARPGECYLEEVGMFGDLPLVSLKERRRVSDVLLLSLGVQAHFEVSLIFSQLSTLQWDHRQLIKYMEKHREQLSATEKHQLGAAKIYPAIGVPDKKFPLSELYTDHPVVRLLRLPVLEWKAGGIPPSSTSPTTLFMTTELGLKTSIAWPLLLESISKVGSQDRALLYRYFVERYVSEYKTTFDPKKIDFACIAVAHSKDDLARPSQVFTDEGLQALGFNIVSPDLQPFARLFGVEKHPPPAEIVQRLVDHKFTPEAARELFAYLSTIAHHFSQREIGRLAKAVFVPHAGTWWSPGDVYLSRGIFEWSDFFVVVDFGTAAVPFLTACGVQREPTAESIARRVCSDPQAILGALGTEKYMELIQWIGSQAPSVSSATLRELHSTSWLLGLEYYHDQGRSDKTPTMEEDDALLGSRYVLDRAENIFIIDDTLSQQVFACLAVPDAALEATYAKFGTRRLSECVKMGWNFTGVPRTTEVSKRLAELIKSRAPLLVVEGASSGRPHKHAAQAIERFRRLQVTSVDAILILRSFSGRHHQQATTACLKSADVLLITQQVDYFDVANVLVRLMHAGSSRLPDALLVSVLLSSSLAGLRAKGFAVDQLLGNERPRAQVAEDQAPEGSSAAPPSSGSPPKLNRPLRAEASPSQITEHLSSGPSQRHGDRPAKAEGDTQGPKSRVSSMLGAIKHAIQGRRNPTESISSGGVPVTSGDPELRRTLTAGVGALQRNQRDDFSADTQTESLAEGEAAASAADSYCEVIPGTALTFVGDLEGVSVYIANHYDSARKQAFTSTHSQDLRAFSKLLRELARVFGAPEGVVHIFFDEATGTVAFNRGHTLFFNLAHFIRQANTGHVERLSSWFMTFCHELAHNFIG